MNTNSKTILAGTILTALFAATPAIADGDDDQFFYEKKVNAESVVIENNVSTESVVRNRVNYQLPSVMISDDSIVSGRK